ncbi:MAG: hypothetical protein KKH44_03755 [Bacteroidetes bacterium]|nr:hypothetical protein [Bacteroidota bacterium]
MRKIESLNNQIDSLNSNSIIIPMDSLWNYAMVQAISLDAYKLYDSAEIQVGFAFHDFPQGFSVELTSNNDSVSISSKGSCFYLKKKYFTTGVKENSGSIKLTSPNGKTKIIPWYRNYTIK